MIGKLVFLVVLACVWAKKTELEIEEGGEHFKQVIITNKEEGTETFITPKHRDRDAVTKKIFHKLGLVANKVDGKEGEKNLCVLEEIGEGEKESVETDEAAIEKTGAKFPFHRVEIIEDRLLLKPIRKGVPKAVKKFCRGYTLVKGEIQDFDLKKIAKAAVKEAIDAKKDARKRAVVREFIACTNASTMKIMTCSADKLRAQCKVRRPSCTYKITCPLEAQKGGFDCKGLHKLNSIVCCDYDC